MKRNTPRWQILVGKSISLLAKHKIQGALKGLEQALACCPVQKVKDLDRILFYLGVAFVKLKRIDDALKCWSTALHLLRNGLSARMIKRYSNCYGMIKQSTPRLDDWQAFYSIQYARYMKEKKTVGLCSMPERDMIRDLIYGCWMELNEKTGFEKKTPEEKIRIFSNTRVIFPLNSMPELLSLDFWDIIPVDFGKNRRLEGDDQCYCGSGLLFKNCCGHTPPSKRL